jgi:hypothetical protein
MADELVTEFLKLLTAPPFQRTPRPKVTVAKLVTGMQRLGTAEVNEESLIKTLQTAKGRGFANTIPKIILPNELPTASFEIWITPLGRDTVAAAQAS